MRKARFIAMAAGLVTTGLAATPAFASGAGVTQVSTVTVNASDPTVIDVGTINSQFRTISIDASGQTFWCTDNPYCYSDPTGTTNPYHFGPAGGPAPDLPVGTLLVKVGSDGSWNAYTPGDVLTSASPADVYVTYNDDVFSDNSGSYSLTITRVKPAS